MGDQVESAKEAWQRAALERDLALTLTRPTTEPFVPGRERGLELTIANRSTREPHRFVLPGDGSVRGRAPQVWFTVQRRDGKDAPWRPAPPIPISGCGNYDPVRDVITLSPGESTMLHGFSFLWHWDVDGASDVRVVAHYAFDRRQALREVKLTDDRPLPSFELASEALELPIAGSSINPESTKVQ
jgi:hypothetical protein